MRLLLIAAVALAANGCAVFQKSDERAASVAPLRPAAPAQPVRFKPAYEAGLPTALMPCRNSAAIGETCKRSTVSHERRGDMPSSENSETFSEATTVSLTTE